MTYEPRYEPPPIAYCAAYCGITVHRLTRYPEFKQRVSFNDSVESLSVLCTEAKPEFLRNTDYPVKLLSLSFYSVKEDYDMHWRHSSQGVCVPER